MSTNFISRTSNASALKASLDVGADRIRGIADRVARAGANQQAFTLPSNASATQGEVQPESIDLEQEMASLADEQLRFEATARILQKTYAGLRASIRSQ